MRKPETSERTHDDREYGRMLRTPNQLKQIVLYKEVFVLNSGGGRRSPQDLVIDGQIV